MAAAHGGQVLASRSVVEWIGDRLPDGFAWRDLGSVRLRDLTSPERLYQLAHPSLRETFPALRSLESTPNNLPRQLTSFVGRERELVEARALLSRTRLLTLTGVGGLGKTRFSLQLAAERARRVARRRVVRGARRARAHPSSCRRRSPPCLA